MHKFKEMLMDKLDMIADAYKNKDPKDISPAALDAWGKVTDMLVDISAVEGMDEYGDYLDNNSGERGRSRRTDRFISREMDPQMRRMSRRMHDSYGDSYDGYNDSGDMEAELEDMINDKSLPRSKREAAKAMLNELRKANM